MVHGKSRSIYASGKQLAPVPSRAVDIHAVAGD
jgi:hypothetical protein